MTFRELFEEDSFKIYFQEVEEFTNQKLEEYLDLLQKKELKRGGKEIFDAVWGNVEFSNGEIYILDSPLLQRLRDIKHLGLAYYVYCGSDYSRFYHTIGVVYLADRMATAINRCEFGTNEQEKQYFRITARLAAIFHDAGHMFLSHVSEHYFSKSPKYPRNNKDKCDHENTVEHMLQELEKKAGKKVALHELLSCMIVNTSIVKQMLKCVIPFLEINLEADYGANIDEIVEYISSFITGVPIDRKILPYACIINGPIDADRCDYLSRDSHVTRVPVAVDISRITQKLSVVESNDINRSLLWNDMADDKSKFYELAMKDSAEKALFQLCIARTIMYDSVYYHHKVLTAETKFREIIDFLANLETPVFTSFTEILNYTDSTFNQYFFDQLKMNRSDEDVKCIERTWHELKDLYDRVLAKRVACLTTDFLDGMQGKKEALYDDIMTSMSSGEERKFVSMLQDEYVKVRAILDEVNVGAEGIDIFVIQTPTNIFDRSRIQVPIDLGNGNQREFKGYEFVNSRETSSSASYIVTGEDDRIAVLMALEMVLYREYQILLKKEALACGKFEPKKMLNSRRKLYKNGYYSAYPKLIPDTIVYNVISGNKVEKLVKKYSAYEGPNGYKLLKENVVNFFKQIVASCTSENEYKTIIDGIYRLLDNALFIDREYITNHIGKSLKAIANEDKCLYVIPLGGSRDSAKHMIYYFNDLDVIEKKIETEKTLAEVLDSSETKQIVFFDDGSFSGTQLVSIMQEYLGVETKTKEHHVDELSLTMKEALLSKKMVYLFIAFNQSKENEIKEELAQIGIENAEFVWIEDMSTRYLGDRKDIFADDNQRELVKRFLSKVGYSVLKSSKYQDGVYREGWNEERIKKSALGYNDAQQMVFLKSSVPTYTITAFWKSGIYNDFYWEPLFRRTQK